MLCITQCKVHTHTFQIGGDRVEAGDGGLGTVGEAPKNIVLSIDAEPSLRQILLVITIIPAEKRRRMKGNCMKMLKCIESYY